ncbi:MAG: hypothetical protein D6739_00035, partial [Nitrospirae bacterium]
MARITVKIEGMSCGHCERAVAQAAERVDGVRALSVSHERGEAELEVVPGADLARVAAEIAEEGYT